MTEPDVEGTPPPAPEAPPSLVESLVPVASDWAAGEAAQARLAGWGTAPGALGGLAQWVGSVRPGTVHPFQRIRLVAFAADHGVDDGAAPSAGAAAARALLAGEGALPLLAQRAGVSIRLVDAGLAGEPLPGGVSERRVRAGSPPLDLADPLTPAEVEAALDLGALVADEEVDGGADLVVPVVLAESAIVPATVLIGALCGVEPVRALGYDPYVPDPVWIARCAAVRDGLRRVSRAAATLATRRLLATGGGADLAAAAGFLVRTAARRTPALLDGVGAAAAALVARALAPDAPSWWHVPHASGRAGEKQAFAALRLRPAIDLGVRLGDGAGALLTLPILTAAVDLAQAAPQSVEAEPEILEVTVDEGDQIGGVGGYDAGVRAPDEVPEPEPAGAGAAGAGAAGAGAAGAGAAGAGAAGAGAAGAGAERAASGDAVPITAPEAVDPAAVEPIDPADPLALDPEPPPATAQADAANAAAVDAAVAAGADAADAARADLDPADPLAVDAEPAVGRGAVGGSAVGGAAVGGAEPVVGGAEPAGLRRGDGAAPSGG